VNRRTFVTAATLGVASIAGCSALPGGDDGSDDDSSADLGDQSTGATDVTQTLRIPVSEETTGQTLQSISATYPRDRFVVDSAGHDAITVGVDSSGDGSLDEEYDSGAISGSNNNDYSFTITLDTSYELKSGDIVMLDYPAIDNPSEPGEYDITVSLNEGPERTVTVQIE